MNVGALLGRDDFDNVLQERKRKRPAMKRREGEKRSLD
jgi:hypothetical protein